MITKQKKHNYFENVVFEQLNVSLTNISLIRLFLRWWIPVIPLEGAICKLLTSGAVLRGCDHLEQIRLLRKTSVIHLVSCLSASKAVFISWACLIYNKDFTLLIQKKLFHYLTDASMAGCNGRNKSSLFRVCNSSDICCSAFCGRSYEINSQVQ